MIDIIIFTSVIILGLLYSIYYAYKPRIDIVNNKKVFMILLWYNGTNCRTYKILFICYH